MTIKWKICHCYFSMVFQDHIQHCLLCMHTILHIGYLFISQTHQIKHSIGINELENLPLLNIWSLLKCTCKIVNSVSFSSIFPCKVRSSQVSKSERAVPDHEFTIFRIPDINRIVNSKSGRIRIPDIRYQIPTSEADCIINQNFLIHCSLVITWNLGSKGLHVIEMEGFC